MAVEHDCIVIDTNAYQAIRKSYNRAHQIMGAARQIVIPIIVEAELKYGFKYGNQEQRNLNEWKEFLNISKAQIKTISANTVDIYAFLMTQLRKNGTPLPVNDVWIASIAMDRGAPLLTFDRHFEKVPGLRVIN